MRRQMTWMIALTLVASPAITYGAESTGTDEKLNLRNVELTPAGSLEGQILTTTGEPMKNVQVRVHSQKDVTKVSQQVVTDKDGRFLVTGLKTGACVLEAGEDTYAVRVWEKGVAPPKSLKNIALINGSDDTVRGNMLSNNRLVNKIRCMSPQQKLLLGLLVGAAIAIPLALDDDGS